MAQHLNTFMDEGQITVKEPTSDRVVGKIKYEPESGSHRVWVAESVDRWAMSTRRGFASMTAAEYWILSEYLENEEAHKVAQARRLAS